MLRERGISAVTSTTVMVIITVLIGILAATTLLDFANVLSGEPRVEGAVTYSSSDGTLDVRVVSLQAADNIYIRRADNGTMNWTGATATEHGYLITGVDDTCDVTDSATATGVGGERLLVIAENGETRRVVQTIDA